MKDIDDVLGKDGATLDSSMSSCGAKNRLCVVGVVVVVHDDDDNDYDDGHGGYNPHKQVSR